MAGYNRVVLMGNLTRDPEVRETPTGVKVADLRLAVSETYRSRQSNERKEVTCFVDVVVWDRQAELCGEYLAKGRPILVEGRLQLDEWKTEQGETRSRLRVRADKIQFLGGRRETEDRPEGNATPQTPPPQSEGATDRGSEPAMSAMPRDEAGDEDDLPF